ncbi:pleckstrin homology domain-containing family A member 7 isoform X3 [Rana temporaria]|uniref:pleckstrin homology domain-containing family A member 7 isoform X3 n=1 Tax=Rana temporaria TaxID=8407 RepID=UPI001AAD00BB|nr:pleckstrin homology domain-containing family A member 7 isoform X3 [Rana temporaria]
MRVFPVLPSRSPLQISTGGPDLQSSSRLHPDLQSSSRSPTFRYCPSQPIRFKPSPAVLFSCVGGGVCWLRATQTVLISDAVIGEISGFLTPPPRRNLFCYLQGILFHSSVRAAPPATVIPGAVWGQIWRWTGRRSHNQRTTTFRHPVTGDLSPENAEFDLREGIMSPQQLNQRPYSMVSEGGSTAVTASTADTRPPPKVLKSNSKAHSFGKRDQSIKRNPNVPVLVRGWLYKQDSSGMKLWKRRWFLLSDFCLFYYKDSKEESILGSIPLPGYIVSPAGPEDRINRKYSFKAVHNSMRAYIQHREHENPGMRTYFFSADTQEDMNGWIRAMNQATLVQSTPDNKREIVDVEWPAVPVNNHTESFKEFPQPETVQMRSSYSKPKELPAPRNEEPRRNSREKDQYRDMGLQDGYREEGEKERYPVVGEKERYRETAEKEHFREAAEKEHFREAAEKEHFREAAEKEHFREVADKERYREAADKERYREAADKERYREAADKDRYRETADKERHREAADKERYRETADKEHYRQVADKDRYRNGGDNKRQREPDKEPNWTGGDKERQRKGGDKERFTERIDKDYHYRDLEEQERFRNGPDRESFVAHKNTINANGGKAQNSFLYSDRQSAFTDFTKRYRYAPPQTPQPQTLERNGTLPASFRTNTSPMEQNGADTYKRGFVSRAEPEKHGQRRSVMGQVEQWVKIQKADGKSVGAEHERYQTLPKTSRHPPSGSPPPIRNLPSDYKYAQDRVSHLKMSNEERQATKEGMVWQLYEWQQRQQFKHGSPTGQICMGTMDAADRVRAKSMLDVPRCVSVPPSPSDMPPPGPPKFFPPRRPHTPAERLMVRPEEGAIDVPYLGSPQKSRVSAVKSAAHVDRRSMPSMGYMTHTVSAPSLHGKSADDTYLQLKKELEYLDLKVVGRESLKDRSSKPVRIAESDVDVKLSILCEQDRVLQDLEDKIRALKDNKDKLETVLEVLHRQMDQYKDQPQHTEKISYQQRLLQEDLVQIRAEMSKVSTDMENSWNEYLRLESDVIRLRQMLQEQMNRSPSSQDRTQLQKDLWRIEDVTAGLSSNKLNYKVLVESFKNPERKTVPLVSSTFVPSGSTAFTSVRSKSVSSQNQPSLVMQTLEAGLYHQPYTQSRSQSQPQLLQKPELRLQSPTRAPTPPKLDDGVPPRPPLPDMYSPDDLPPNIPPPPALPPPPRESSVVRHTSVRGLKRQSDERKRDREMGQGTNGDYRVELRTYVSEPELANLSSDSSSPPSGFLGSDSGYQTLPTRGFSGSTSRLPQSSSSAVSSYVTLRRGTDTSKDRPKSAFERLYAGDNQRGKISAEEQLQRMKRHQKALVRERKRTLSQGEKPPASGRPASRPVSADISSWRREQEFDLQLLERAARDAEERDWEDQDWVQAIAVPITEMDLEPQDYNLDISKELATPDKVEIPERYIDMDPEEPLTHEELEARRRKVQKIKNILARSSVHNLQSMSYPDEMSPSDMDSQVQEQERMITISYALASEASQRSKQVAAHAGIDH